MKRKLVAVRPSPAMIVALVALVSSLTGGAVAATLIDSGDIKHGSVTGRDLKNLTVARTDIKNNAINSSKVANGTLQSADFAPGQFPTGPQGPKGDKGDKGDAGAPGTSGQSALTPLQTGETIRGVVGGDYEAPATSGDFRAFGHFPIPAPAAVDGDSVDVDGSADESANRCTGSAAAPTAPAGVVCIYVADSGNASDFSGLGAPDNGGSPYGFKFNWAVSATGDTFAYASWAYTAP